VYTSAGSKTIELTVQEGVVDVTSKTLQVNALPQNILSTEDRCGNGPVLFTATTADGDAVEFSLDGVAVEETDNTAPFEFSREINENESLTVWARAIITTPGCQGEWTQSTASAFAQPVTGEISVESPNPANTDFLDVACRNSSRTYLVTGADGSEYHWQIPVLSLDETGPGTLSVNWSVQEDEYAIRVQEISAQGCEGTIREETVFVSDPEVWLGPDQEICIGENATFEPNRVFEEYLWHDGSTGDQYTGNTSETVSLLATNSFGCSDTDSAELMVFDNPVLDLGNDTSICDQNGYILYPGNYFSYEWSTGETSSAITVYPGQGLISLTVRNIHNCSATDEIEILPCNAEKLFESISNAFTPNGDGVHDTWVINNIEVYPETVIEVFDRTGRSVFRVEGGYQNDWNGTFNGKQLPMDTYYYIIDFKSEDIQPKKGTVTIIR
jgi:gliding motility-associated-like protein